MNFLNLIYWSLRFAFALMLMLPAFNVLAQDETKPAKLTDKESKFFENKIRPVLARECYGCHSTRAQVKGGLWLDTKVGTRNGGDSGAGVVPGELEESSVWGAINHDDFRMPPGKKLSKNEIADFKQWIEMGAPDPRVKKISKVNSKITEEDIAEGKQFWSFKNPRNPDLPEIENTAWPKNDIDHFILSELEQRGLKPNPDTDATTFLRRVSYDLIGLPPTIEQIKWVELNWGKDQEKTVAHIVDSLLEKPEFGERWGRHWLDVARYAESTGKELNMSYPNAWRYRDYVIDLFNKDKPYNRFVMEQVAGDLLPIKTDEQWAENLVATGFLTLGPKTLTETNGLQFENDLIDEQIDVTTRVMLGVSVACARCHDHKFDPIPQSDYYAVAGIFKNMSTHYGTVETFQNKRSSNLLILPVDDLNPFDKKLSAKALKELKERLVEKQRLLNEYRRQRRALQQGETRDGPVFSLQKFAIVNAEVGAIKNKLASYDEKGNPFTYFMGVQESEKIADARLLVRGEFDKPAQTVRRGLPQVLVEDQPRISRKSSGRLEFARWIGSEENPLTARVMTNRIWQHMFGQGIVTTPENFGSTGMAPSNPQLLDRLARQFMDNQWSVKKLIREIATSHAYRINSSFNEDNFKIDPENKYVWRVSPRRLDAEAIRDSMLKFSGQLESERPRASRVAEFGPGNIRDGVFVGSLETANQSLSNSMTPGKMGSRRMGRSRGIQASGFAGSIAVIDAPSSHRSVYLPIVRQALPRSLEVFDFAESSMVVGVRETSNTPDQGLYFLNNDFVLSQSDAIARRIENEASNLSERLRLAFLLIYGRKATADELKTVEKFYRDFEVPKRARNRSQSLQKLSAVCQAILGSAEFRYLN